MNADWKNVRLAEISVPVSRLIPALAGTQFRTIGVKWWGEGAYERQTIDGSQTAAETLSMVRQGDLIINKIWVRHGSIAIASEAVDGCAASNEFPTFELNQNLVLPRWIHWLTKTRTFWAKCDALSRGTSGKNRIKPELFLTIEIPLPPLEEQRRIVARIEELTVKIEEARGLREDAVRELGNLLPRTLSQILNSNRWESHLLEKVLAESPRNGLAPQVEVADGEVAMLRINAVSSSPTRFVDTAACKMIRVTSEVAEPFTLKNDDIFIVRYNGDINRVAKAAVFKSQEPVKIVYPDKLMRLRPDRSKMTPDFLVYALGCQSVRLQIEEMGKTTAGQIGVSGKDAKSFRIPVPPLEEQSRIVAYLDDLQSRVEAVQKLQIETTAELDALLPSILDKAFKGEL